MQPRNKTDNDRSRVVARRILLGLLAVVWIGGGYYLIYRFFQHDFQADARKYERLAITNNFRQIASAADQYFLEHGVTEVHVKYLVGEGAYIRELESVAGESYDDLVVRPGMTLTVEDERGEIHQFQY